nr:von Willebrand factor type A domain-containing protein [Flammeovirgaceae bacterium]
MRNSVLRIIFISLAIMIANACSKNTQIAKEEPTPDLTAPSKVDKRLNQLSKSVEKKEMEAPMEYFDMASGAYAEEEIEDSFDGGRSHNTEEYDHIVENVFHTPKSNPLSTFSIDVDNASYTNARRFINGGQMPYKDAVRIEEFINYFDYDYPQPKDEVPFSINTEVGPAPWNEKHKLVHIGLQGKELDYENLS